MVIHIGLFGKGLRHLRAVNRHLDLLDKYD